MKLVEMDLVGAKVYLDGRSLKLPKKEAIFIEPR
jgi:hypothetical protein